MDEGGAAYRIAISLINEPNKYLEKNEDLKLKNSEVPAEKEQVSFLIHLTISDYKIENSWSTGRKYYNH